MLEKQTTPPMQMTGDDKVQKKSVEGGKNPYLQTRGRSSQTLWQSDVYKKQLGIKNLAACHQRKQIQLMVFNAHLKKGLSKVSTCALHL